MTFDYRTAQPLEYLTNRRHLVFLCTGLVLEQQVQYLGHNPQTNHFISELQKFWYSNVSGIQMVSALRYPLYLIYKQLISFLILMQVAAIKQQPLDFILNQVRHNVKKMYKIQKAQAPTNDQSSLSQVISSLHQCVLGFLSCLFIQRSMFPLYIQNLYPPLLLSNITSQLIKNRPLFCPSYHGRF